MTDDQLIQMAKEAFLPYEYKTGLPLYIPQLRRFADLVAAAEREACADLCERIWPGSDRSGHEWSDGFADGTCDCAAAIRARGQE